MSRYYADQLALQQQEADRLRKAQKSDVEQFRQQNQVGQRQLHECMDSPFVPCFFCG